MARQIFPGRLLKFILLALIGVASFANATPPVLTSAVSRMTHGSAGSFDIQLPLSGGTGIECRTVASGMTLVLTFDQPVVSGTAAVTLGTATPGTPTFSGTTMTVPLTAIADAQAVTVTVSTVKNAGNEVLASAAVPFRVLLGDVNANGLLTGSDVNIVRQAVATSNIVNGANFRSDLNANGVLTGSDLNISRAQTANAATVAGGSTFNTAPTIGTIANQTAISGQASTPVGFSVGDAESNPSTLAVTATTSDQVNLPNASVAITGTGTSRSMTITAPSGLSTSTNVMVTLTVSDGLLTSSSTFNAYVTPPPTVYLATLTPVSGVNSLGSGTATLSVSGDQTYAILRYSYSNLAGTDTDDAIYGPGNNVFYDVPMGKARGDQQPDGSYLWTFTNGGSNTVAMMLSTIASNSAYMTIESTAFTSGELQGTFRLLNGSQTFTAPPPPPQITINPPTPADASRFLQQAGFGGTGSEITTLSNPGAANANIAINDWLTTQFNTQIPISPDYSASANPVAGTFSSSSMYKGLYDRVTAAQGTSGYADSYQDDRIHEGWWKNALTAPDILRQRVATAYSEIFVVSQVDSQVDSNEAGLATYHDMLADDAFGNFRQLLADVTLHPVMGEYLNMMNNNWINSSTAPNENYAREIMQLFTIGLYMLQPDGTLMIDQAGQPIPTYSQSTITQFAEVFTGWNQNGTPVVIPLLPQPSTGPTITAASEVGTTVTITIPSTAAYSAGQKVIIAGVVPSGYNGTYTIASIVNTTSFTYTSSTSGLANGTSFGTVSGPIVVSNLNSYWQKPMVLSPSNGVYHSQASKTLLNYTGAATYPGAGQPAFIPALSPQSAASANAELNFALDNIFNHPNVGPFFCKRLIQRLVCSNPSPGYVYRVAQVFANDGTGTRGNMKAVITAILTDYEARSPAVQGDPGYGHAREPLIRLASILRSLNAKSASGKWMVGKTDTTFDQTYFRSPTVFNYFDPSYQQPGSIQQAGLVSPELQIVYATTIINAQNLLYTGIYGNYNADGSSRLTGTGFRGDNEGSDVYVDFSTSTGSGLQTIAQTSGVGPMVDQVGLLLMGPAMDPNMKSQIVNFIQANYVSNDYINQVKAAVYLVATSAQCAAQK